MTLRVYYEDTDVGGVVYYANYLKFCERARSELFFSKGESPLFEGGHFVVRHIEADYLGSAVLGDLLEVSAEVVSVRGTGLQMHQSVRRGNELLFTLDVRLVYLMTDGRVGRLDAAKREKLKALLEE
ncbi:YbgC/FadM family acyl-CoA thioesterase [Sulfurimonas sp. HSL-3221]|uniref:YbgC/FadM family acyl-CoA thioesterase n=1 Tax=Sulfurimonadaceae TaxID=2771471 RepID=UPI001E2E5AF7|nr:YbgC/FadM family acyl-CoA thioesterase [Sulfurimonas sp. HSL-3221]UFS61388.1 YbgC/FadM family acyl-CoA thioesterase [Sulfurimonas sp. HSL-3221]